MEDELVGDVLKLRVGFGECHEMGDGFGDGGLEVSLINPSDEGGLFFIIKYIAEGFKIAKHVKG
jgi:hypothetical protein